jgi:hypothetical protein
VTADVHARYFGAELDDHSLTPSAHPRIAPTRFTDWLSESTSGHTSAKVPEPKGGFLTHR